MVPARPFAFFASEKEAAQVSLGRSALSAFTMPCHALPCGANSCLLHFGNRLQRRHVALRQIHVIFGEIGFARQLPDVLEGSDVAFRQVHILFSEIGAILIRT